MSTDTKEPDDLPDLVDGDGNIIIETKEEKNNNIIIPDEKQNISPNKLLSPELYKIMSTFTRSRSGGPGPIHGSKRQ